MTERHKKALYAAAIAIFILFTLAVSWFVGRPLIRFVRQPEQFRAWVQGHGLLGQLAFLGMTVLQIVIAIIPGEPLELGAGYAFGFWRGTLLCEIGILLGGLLVCLCDLLARTMFAPYEIPVGIVLSLLGGPFFVYLILRRGKGGLNG